jgi:hypothetical protein
MTPQHDLMASPEDTALLRTYRHLPPIPSTKPSPSLQGMAVAVKWGITFQQLTSVVGVHPTAAEEMVNLKNTPFRRVAKEGQDKQDEAAGKQDRQEQGKEQQQRASAAAA